VGDAVAGAQAGALRRAAGHDLAEDGRQRGPVQAQADALHEVAFDVVAREPRQVERELRDAAALVDDLQRERLALQGGLQHAPAQFLPGRHWLAARLAHQVARVQAGRARERRRRRLGDHRPGLGQADHVERGIDGDGEEEIEYRPGGDDRQAPADALAVEGARLFLGRHGRLALVEHLDVAAERHCGDDPFGAVAPAAPGGKRPAEAHREAQHLDVAQARGKVMAVFVHHDQHAEGDNES
jgi:hypothetical protein